MSPFDKDRLIRSVVSSEALEGVYLAYDHVAAILEAVLREPPIQLGE